MDLKMKALIQYVKDILFSVLSDVKLKAALITFASGIFIHLFSLVNILHNYDDITYFDDFYGTGMASGRWALTYIGDLFGKIWGWPNTSYLNGIMFLFLLAATAWLIMDIFRIRKLSLGVLIGLSLITFPASVSTLFFKYTAVYYGFAILLSAAAVWILEKFRFGGILSVWCIAVSLGIYQAYLPFTISLMLMLLIFKILKDDASFADSFKNGLYDCVILIAGVLLYFGILKLSLYVFHTELLDYQGVSNMGNIGFVDIFPLIRRAVKEFLTMPLYNDWNLAPNRILKIGYIVLYIISVVLIVFMSIRKWAISSAPELGCETDSGEKTVSENQEMMGKRKGRCMGRFMMLLLLLLCFPIAVNFIVIMCPDSSIYTLMVFSFVVLLIFPVVIYECIDASWKFGSILKKLSLMIAVIMMCNYTYIANVNYQVMYFTDRQTENYLGSMLTQVRMTEGYRSTMPWVFIGDNINDPAFQNFAANDMMYGGNGVSYINAYSRFSWMRAYLGFDIPYATEEQRIAFYKDERIKKMPCYPDHGSIKMIDGMVVIKLEDVD